MNLLPTISILEDGTAPPYRDILVTIQESLRLDVLEEMNRLEGTWIIKSATLDDKEVHAMVGREFIFTGDQIAMNAGAHEVRNQYVLDLTEKTKRIRILPRDLPNARPSAGTYEIDGDTLKLKMRTDGDNSANASAPRSEMTLTMQRK